MSITIGNSRPVAPIGLSRDDDLLAATARNMAEYGELTTLACGGRVDVWKGVWMCDAVSPHPYRNMVIPTDPLPADAGAQLPDRLLEFFGRTDRWVVWSIPKLQMRDPRLIHTLTEPVMALRNRLSPPVAPIPGLEIVDVRGAEDILTFERIRAKAYPMPHLLEADPSQLFNERVLTKQHRLWLGYLDDKPVATGGSFTAAGVNEVKGVSTLREYRGRGIGTAMTLHALAASELPAVLNSGIGAERTYERLGFATIGSIEYWTGSVLPKHLRGVAYEPD